MSNLLSYANTIVDRMKFRQSGTKAGGQFNLTDTPGHKYFKVFFYFDNGDIDGLTNSSENGSSGGLLSPTWTKNIEESQYYQYNSAWTYLKMNYEDERAELLENFVNLLSNISSESPWYFTEFGGLDAALERKQTVDTNFSIPEERKKISIKCLPDAYDDRIGTLLDLYRSIVWSWVNKREVLPSNLRKFDMGIMIFDNSIKDWGKVKKDEVPYKSSYKYVEFHNCEIDYNSSKGAYATLDDKVGFQPEYTIEINYDDCYESRFNEFLLKELGDLIKWDWSIAKPSEYGFDSNFQTYQTNMLNEMLSNSHKSELLATAADFVDSTLKKAVLGNLYTLSLTRLGDQLAGAASGQVWSTARAAVEYAKDAKQRKEGGTQYVDEIGTIFPEPTNNTKYVSRIGNIYKSETLRNNI